MTPTLDIAIFSYNRPDYLGDCVASVLRHAPDARLRVYDDGSDDPQTLALLDSLGDRAVRRDPGDTSRHGGLYGNMQFALDQAEGDWLMFLQDDMQIVRDITATEMTDMAAIWDAHPRAAFLCPIFWKQARLFRFRREVEFRASPDRFVTPEGRLPANRKTTLSYFDVAIGHVERLRA
ncbi:MAG: glycosyltransferase, partial [Pseudomonadota bacterium]